MWQNWKIWGNIVIYEKKSKISLLLEIVIGIALGQLILMGLVMLINKLRNPLSSNPQVEEEIKQTLGGMVNGLKSYYVENAKFPTTYSAIVGPYSHSLDYHKVEINPLDDYTVVFKIIPKVSNLYAFSGMVVYDRTTSGYQSIVCQSEQPSQVINIPEVVSQCPFQTRLMVE